MRRFLSVLFPVLAVVLCGSVSLPADDAKTADSILAANRLVDDPAFMVHEELIRQIDVASAAWLETYENVKSIADIESYQEAHKAFFLKNLGRLWEKTPLNPQVTGAINLPEYRVEKIILETQPHFYATGTMFLPNIEKFAPPYPGLLIVCGHWQSGKAAYDHQTLAALGAMNGLAVFVFDPIEQGERFQNFDEEGKLAFWGTAAHNMIGATSILLGRNTATFEFWDNSRALDYLQSRDDVIADRLGVAGNSGGGTQTSYMMALDERVACAAPCCFLTGFYGELTHVLNPQDAEQNIFGQVAFGMDHQDYPIMRAPKPTLLCCKTNDFFCTDDTWTSFRFANRIYSRLDAPEKLSIVEIEGGHGYSPEVYNATIRWMVRWLTDRTELTYTIHPDAMVPIFPEEQLNSVDDPKGVMSLPNARTTFDLNRDLAKELAAERAEKLAGLSADEFAALVRKTAVIAEPDDLFSLEGGIYSNPEENWEKPASAALFAEERGFEPMACGLKMHGAKSRVNQAKKSFKLCFRDRYDGLLNCDLFENGITEFNDVLLRAAWESSISTQMRDVLMHELAADCTDSLPTQAYRYCALYLNGEYWGLYALREAHSEEHYARHYGLDPESVVMSQGDWGQGEIAKELWGYLVSHDMRDSENYAHVLEHLDVESVIAWSIIESYSGNIDMNSPNMRFYESSEDGMMRYALVDLDLGFFEFGEPNLAMRTGNPYSQAVLLLMDNPDFRALYLQRLSEYLHGPLSDESFLALVDRLSDETRSEVSRDYQRWNNFLKDWQHEIDTYLIGSTRYPNGHAGTIASSARRIFRLTDEEWARWFADLVGA